MGGVVDGLEDESSGGRSLWPAFMERVLAAQFPPEASGQPEPQHAKVADQGPEGVTEGGRTVALDQGVTGPGQAVADDQGGNGKAPIGQGQGENQERDAAEAARVMQLPRARPAVLGQVKGPKVAVALKAGQLRSRPFIELAKSQGAA